MLRSIQYWSPALFMPNKKYTEGDTIVIKKYANRRLYNTHSSSYITLEDLRGAGIHGGRREERG